MDKIPYKKLYEDAIIIAPRPLWQFFYEYRRQYPEVSFSLLTMEEVEKRFLYQYDDRALRHLLEKGYPLSSAKDLLKVLSYFKKEKDYQNERLKQWKLIFLEMEEKGLLYRYAYPEKEFAHHKIVVHGYRDGQTLSKALQDVPDLAISYDSPYPIKEQLPEVRAFASEYAELHYACNKIASMLDNGIDPEDICLLRLSEDDEFTLPRLASSYGFDVDFSPKISLAETNAGRIFLEEYFSNGDFSSCVTKMEELGEEGEQVIDCLNPLLCNLPRPAQYDIFHDALSAKEKKNKRKIGAVSTQNEAFLPNNKHILFLHFSLENAPHISKDDDFASDEEKSELGMATSKQINSAKKEEIVYLLSHPGIEVVSHPRLTSKGEFHPSSLIKDLSLTVRADNDLDYEYSSSFASLWGSDLLDRYIKYRQDSPKRWFLYSHSKIPFRGYSSKFKPFQSPKAKGKIALSYSSIDSYYKCPFSYYARHVLKIIDGETSFGAKIGTIAHGVLERMRNKDFDFDAEFQKQMDEIGGFSEKEKALLTNIKSSLRGTVSFLKTYESYMDNPVFENEKKVETKIGEDAYLIGRIDKIILTGEESQYLTIVDYKTSLEDFDPALNEFGLKLQLPTYAYFASEVDSLKDKELIALLISPILSKGKDDSEEGGVDESELRLKGVFLGEQEKAKTLDPNLTGEFIMGMKLTKTTGGFAASKSVVSKEELDGYAGKAKEKAIEAVANIRAGNFEVSPISISGSNLRPVCSFCPYSDICFLRPSMIRRVSIKKEEEEDGE